MADNDKSANKTIAYALTSLKRAVNPLYDTTLKVQGSRPKVVRIKMVKDVSRKVVRMYRDGRAKAMTPERMS